MAESASHERHRVPLMELAWSQTLEMQPGTRASSDLRESGRPGPVAALVARARRSWASGMKRQCEASADS